MEGLVGGSRITPPRIHLRQRHLAFVPSSSLQCTKSLYRNRGQDGTKQHLKLHNLIAASIQPLEDFTLSFDNMLPSKDYCGAEKAVGEWTARAMGGSVTLEEALAARLSLFNPSSSQVHDFLEKRPARFSPGIVELVKKLKANSTDVYLVSGGSRHMIKPVASILGIPPENVFANQLLFGTSGEFLGFDKNEPTSRSGGKATAVQQIRKAHNYKDLVMIGDGATDLEARQPGAANLFICYAGVQLREAVAAKADWLVFNFEDLISSLD